MTQTDIPKPTEDPYVLVGDTWPTESESAYHAAKIIADDSSAATSTQSESATDARSKMAGESGETANSVSNGYAAVATQLSEQSREFTTISAWMSDAAGAVLSAKRQVVALVRAGTSEIRYALDSETSGIAVTPSSGELITRYRNEIQGGNSKLSVDLDAIGHALHSDAGSSNTPSYVSVPLTSTAQHSNPAAQVAAYNTGQNPVVEPRQLPEMPRAASALSGTESTSAPVTPSVPSAPTHPVNPTLAGLIAGSGPSGAPASPSAKSPSTASSGTLAGKAAQVSQPNVTHQDAKSLSLPRIPSIPLPDAPAVAESIATTITSATAHQLPTSTAPTTPGSSAPASTGLTPGVSGAPPVLPTPPAGLSPIGGGLPTAPVIQTPSVSQVSPAAPPPGVQTPSPASPPPSAPRGPVVDAAWLQRTYGLAASLDLPKSENTAIPALFITELPEGEAHLHKILATLRHAFDDGGWSQPLSVATIRRGFETKLVYVTSDGLSIHPHGVLLPEGVIPLDEMPSAPTAPEMLGSLMVTDKLHSMLPRGWTVESVLSTVPCGEDSQSVEQYQSLVESGELLECKVSRSRDDVDVDEALRVFARAAIGSGGCGELDVESARIRAARWIGTQPAGYLDTLARFYLSDAAESMSQGSWGEAVYASERYLGLVEPKAQVA